MKLNDKVIIIPNKEYSQEVYSGMTGTINRIFVDANVYEVDLDEVSRKKLRKINASNCEDDPDTDTWVEQPRICRRNLCLFNGGVINTE